MHERCTAERMGEKGTCLEASRVGREAAAKLAVKAKQAPTIRKDANRHLSLWGYRKKRWD